MAPELLADDLERARDLVGRARRVLVLTGAGVSTDSGIPDFRGPSGLWTRDPGAGKVSDLGAFLADPAVRERSWRGYLASPARAARPNRGHLALLELERHDRLALLATQNTDGLHLAAGHDPRFVVELHGTSRTTSCRRCGTTRATDEVLVRVCAGDVDPRCDAPGADGTCGGILKRDTVLFGEPLPREGLEQAVAAASTCDLLLAVGTTLSVYPAAALVPLAARRGVPVVIVNGQPTKMDGEARILVRSPIGDALPVIVGATS